MVSGTGACDRRHLSSRLTKGLLAFPIRCDELRCGDRASRPGILLERFSGGAVCAEWPLPMVMLSVSPVAMVNEV